MLAKKYRGLSAEQIQEIFAKGEVKRGKHLFVRMLSRPSEQVRFAFGVSKKICSTKVERNRILRIAAESIRLALTEHSDLQTFANHFFVLVSRLPNSDLPTSKILADEFYSLIQNK